MIEQMPLPGEHQVQPAGPRYDITERLQREHARLPDHEAQRALREKLRYKHIGRLYTPLQIMGDGVRSGRGIWYVIAVVAFLLGYFNRYGLRGIW